MQIAIPYVSAVWEWILALPSWQGFLLLLALSVLVARVVQVGGDALIRRLTVRIPGDVDDVVLRGVHLPLYLSIVFGGAYLSVYQLDIAPGTDVPLRAGTLSVIAIMWAFALTGIGRDVADELIDGEYVEKQVVPIFQNVWSALILGASIFLLLSFWNVDVTPFLASAGVIGIVVGFAAKDTIANFFGSIALYFDGTYKVGDYVVLDSGERGRVEDVSIRSTVIRTRDDMLVTVPNSVLNSARIVNESTPRRERRVRIPVGVAYGSDADHVEETLLAVAAEEKLVLDHPAPRVRFRGFGNSALDVELLCWISDPVLRGRATHTLIKSVYTAFTAEDIEIPFPQREIAVRTNGETATVGSETAGVRVDDATENVEQ